MSIRARHLVFSLLAFGTAVPACTSDQADPTPPLDDAGSSEGSVDTGTSDSDASEASARDGGCDAGTDSCGGRCVDTSTDGMHCGQCDRACPAGQTCGGGGCLCADANLVGCGDTCLDPKIDTAHCGATPGCGVNLGFVGNRCPSDGYCDDGVCKSCRTWNEAAPVPLIGNLFIQRLVVRDFNRDSRMDIAFTDYAGRAVGVLLGHGDGTFGAPTYFPAAPTPLDLVAADFDHDGIEDLAVGTGNRTTILRGRGDGTFDPGASFEPGGVLAAGDVDGDGYADLAVGLTGEIRVLLRRAGAFTQTATVPISGFCSGLALGDIDGDGHLDVVTHTVEALVSARGKGDGTFHPSSSFDFLTQAGPTLTVADVNDDGRLDALSDTRLFFGQVGGDFQLSASPITVIPGPILLDRLDDDPAVDLVYRENGYRGFDSGLFFRSGKGDGGFHAAQKIVALDKGVYAMMAAGDFNGDGKRDLVVNVTSRELRIFLGAKSTAPECP